MNENYSGQSDKELSVSKGDIVQLLSREGDNWMVECSGRCGLLPDRVLTYGKGFVGVGGEGGSWLRESFDDYDDDNDAW